MGVYDFSRTYIMSIIQQVRMAIRSPSAQLKPIVTNFPYINSFRVIHRQSWWIITLDTIRERLNLHDKNITNLTRMIEVNVLEPLREYGYIISYEEDEGLKGLKYIIRVPKKTKKIVSKVI